ncbi:MAG: Fic family protein [Actinomycetota bacterium]|nr:Fic family protein [Actinomycetota bacterium]MDQ2959198.1 Fic family protein [Actinomycetota bacterium]
MRQLSAADRAIGELAGLGRGLPNPHLLSRALMRREAVLSSRIEGTRASLSDLVLFEIEPTERPGSDVSEVYNYLLAVDHVLDPDRRLPLSLSLLREAHQILLTGVRGGYATPGEFRRTQNWIGPAGAVIDSATYVPPPPERLWDCLGAFEKFLHTQGDLPPLITIGAAHYQFEAIHPFIDGNGRVGRLLVVLLLVEWGLLPAPLLDLSAYIEPRRDTYYASLLNVSTQGDWNGWLTFFLEVVEHQARDALRRAHALHDLRDRMREQTATGRTSASIGRLIDALFDVPMITIPRTQKVLGVTHRAASQNIDKLVELGILREIRHGKRPRLFIAPEVMAAVDTSTPAA